MAARDDVTVSCYLVATLQVEGTPDSLTAAEQLTKGVERGLYAVGLMPAERAAVLASLEDPPDGLAELRGVLLREPAGWGRLCCVCSSGMMQDRRR